MSKAGRKPNDMSQEAQIQRQKAAQRLREVKAQWKNAGKINGEKRVDSDFADLLSMGPSTMRGYCSTKCKNNLPDDLANKLVRIWENLTGENTIPEYWQGKTDEKTLEGYAHERKLSQISTEVSAFDAASSQTRLFSWLGVNAFTAKPSVNALRTSNAGAVSDLDIESISLEPIMTVLCSGQFVASFTKEEIEDIKHDLRRFVLGRIAEKMSKEG